MTPSSQELESPGNPGRFSQCNFRRLASRTESLMELTDRRVETDRGRRPSARYAGSRPAEPSKRQCLQRLLSSSPFPPLCLGSPSKRNVSRSSSCSARRRSVMRLGSTSSTIITRGIIKARRICGCSQPATSYISPSARCNPVNGLACCYVSTIGKPHEYFDLTPL